MLGRRPQEDATDFTSGLLIGADIAFGLRDTRRHGFVMGRELTRLYAAAIGLAGRRAVEIDGERRPFGAKAALAGQI